MNAKWEFLRNEFLSMSIIAGLQRSNIYQPGTSEEKRIEFREYLRNKIWEISIEYEQPVDDGRHEHNIELLAKVASDKFGSLFKEKHFRIGNAQKVLNLFLKYLWCAEKIPTPPQCPFDRLIIEMLPAEVRMNWTQIDTIEDYRKLVYAARERAKTESLADWELRNYPSDTPVSQDNQKETN
jgi:hypothetical protein